MEIALDSNLFENDYKLRSSTMKQIFRYARLTKSTILIPRIVLEEIKSHYRIHLEKAQDKIKFLNERLDNSLLEFLVPDIDFDEQISKYEALILNSQEGIKIEVLENSTDDYIEAIKRGLNHTKPAKKSDDGMRDALIWLCIRNKANSTAGRINFISKNTNDFADESGSALHPDLLGEIRHNHLFRYFQGIPEFFEVHSESTSLEDIQSMKREALQNARRQLLGEAERTQHDMWEFDQRRQYLNYQKRQAWQGKMQGFNVNPEETHDEALQRLADLEEELFKSFDYEFFRERVGTLYKSIGEIDAKLREE